MSAVLYCPVCSGFVNCYANGVTGQRVVACTNCSLVSEVGRGGELLDLGAVTLEDLEVPVVPGMCKVRVFIQCGSTKLREGRES